MANDLDSLLKDFGNPGRYQIIVCVLLTANTFVFAFNNLNMVFMGFTPPHRCKIPDNASAELYIPKESTKDGERFSQCKVFVDPKNHSAGVEPCPNGWDYFYEGSEWSIVGEWDLVCTRQKLVSLASTCYFAGTLIGAPIIGYFTDRNGRKPILLISLLLHSFLGIIQYFAVNFPMFVAFKFIHGFLMQGTSTPRQNLTAEQFGNKHRTEALFCGNLVWTCSQFVLAFLAYICPQWRYLYLVNTLPSLVTISFIWLIPESFRWLLVQQKISRALKVARFYAKRNEITLPEDFEQRVETVAMTLSQKANNRRKNDFRDLFRTMYIRRVTIVMGYAWFSASLVYYGINFSMPDLGGNKYVNFSISAAVELACRLPLYIVLKKLGRKKPIMFGFIASGVLCITSILIKEYVVSDVIDVKWLSITLAFMGKGACSVSAASIILLTTEVFPTIIRAAALGSCAFMNRIGAMMAPQVIVLGIYMGKVVPLIFFGTAAILAGIAIAVVPETKDISLPDTVEEAEAVCAAGYKKKKRKVEIASNEHSGIADQSLILNNLEKEDSRYTHNGDEHLRKCD